MNQFLLFSKDHKEKYTPKQIRNEILRVEELESFCHKLIHDKFKKQIMILKKIKGIDKYFKITEEQLKIDDLKEVD